MKIAHTTNNPSLRFETFDAYGTLSAEHQPLFNDIATLAAQICGTPIALVSLIDAQCQRFISSHGLEATPPAVSHDMSLCAHAILGHGLLQVHDTAQDPRFSNLPMIHADPMIRFYAGMPLRDARGVTLGTLCVIDHQPRMLMQSQRNALAALSRMVVSLLQQLKERQEAKTREYRQGLIADFGQRALAHPDPDTLMDEAVRLVSDTLRLKFCKVLELADDDRSLTMRSAVGWPNHAIGQTVNDGAHLTQASMVLEHRVPIIVQNFDEETRFRPTSLAQRQNIKSGVEVLIQGPRKPFGVLGVHSSAAHTVTPDVVHFAQSVANIIAAALTRRQADEKLAYVSQFDALTELPNRHLMSERLVQAIARSERNGKSSAVVVLNLDGFKLVNNSQGHTAGDQLLAQVAKRLVDCVRSGDTVGRMGGDEFGIVLADLARPEDTVYVVQKILRALAQPFTMPYGEVFSTASAGVSLYGADGSDAASLIKNAEIAMQRAKEHGRNSYQFYAPQMNQRALERMHLESSLRHALERGEFLLYYQPKLGAGSGAVCGAEALLRWKHPQRGLVSPAEFIPVLEETGLILPVGLWVLQTACAQMRTWQDAGLPITPIAINLSARQFQQADLAERVRQILESSKISPTMIELELTESMLMHDPQQAAQTLTQLKQIGVRLSVDDFGTGYSSLSYLKQFPLDTLKIDRTFINNIPHDADDVAIALAIINLAHNLDLEVVAEGVETEHQAHFLVKQGCDMLQGFCFSKPVDAHAFAGLLQQGLPRLSTPQLEAVDG